MIERNQPTSIDPADLALEEYRNSKEYPDNPNLGVWGRINRAFQDGYAKGLTKTKPNPDAFEREMGRQRAEIQRLHSEASLDRDSIGALIDELHALKKNGIWVLLITTPDGHDSPNAISIHINAEEARYSAEEDNTHYRQDHEPGTPIDWTDDPKGGASDGRGYLYCYHIERFDLPSYVVEV